MRKRAALFILVLLIFPVSLHAQIKDKSFSLSPMIGGYTFDGGQNLETAPVYGIRAGYSLTKNWGLEAVFDYARTDLRYSDGSVDFYRYGLDILYHFMPDMKLVPYLAAGVGGMKLNGPNGMDNIDGNFAAVNAGAGIKYFLTDSLALRADLRDIVKFNDTQNNIEYMVGLVYYFGGGKRTTAQAAPERQVVAQAPPPEKEKAPVKEVAPEPCPPAMPAPPPKTDIIEKVFDVVMLPVFFDFDKYDIRPDAEQTLQNNLKWFELNPGQRVRIEASCDVRGSVSYNKRLAQKRTDAVKEWLINHGVDGNLLIATIFGKVNSFDSATTEDGYQMNRRVQFVPAR